MIYFFELIFGSFEIIERIIELLLVKTNDTKVVVTKANANKIVDLSRKVQGFEVPAE